MDITLRPKQVIYWPDRDNDDDDDDDDRTEIQGRIVRKQTITERTIIGILLPY
jgi:hypothetical protein